MLQRRGTRSKSHWLGQPGRMKSLALDVKERLSCVCVSMLGGESAHSLAASVLLYLKNRCPFCLSELHFSLSISPSPFPFLCLAPCTEAVTGSPSLTLFSPLHRPSLPQTLKEIPADPIWHRVFMKLSDTCLNLPCCPLLNRPSV